MVWVALTGAALRQARLEQWQKSLAQQAQEEPLRPVALELQGVRALRSRELREPMGAEQASRRRAERLPQVEAQKPAMQEQLASMARAWPLEPLEQQAAEQRVLPQVASPPAAEQQRGVAEVRVLQGGLAALDARPLLFAA